MSNFTKLMQQAAAGNAGGDFYPYTVDYSARFDGASRMSRTVSAGNRKTWTLSVWVKKAVPIQGATYDSSILSSYSNGNNVAEMAIDADDYVHWEDYASGYRYFLIPSAKLRDPSAWYHIVFRFDTTQATASDRARIYINGVQQTSFLSGYETYPSQNLDGYINYSSYTHYLGDVGAGYRYFNGYMADFNFIDGQSLDPTSFGQSKNGVWIPKDSSGLTFGTNGFLLDFSNSAALGTDVSGNGNNWTPSGLTSSDQMIDTPTNNYCTLSPIDRLTNTTLSNGNLVAATGGSNSAYWSSMGMVPGRKYQFEVTKNSGDMAMMFSVTHYGLDVSNTQTDNLSAFMYYSQGGTSQNRYYYNGSTYAAFPTGFGDDTNGTIYVVLVNLIDNEITIRRNNDATTEATASLPSAMQGKNIFVGYSITTTWPAGNWTWNFGQTALTYALETDYVHISTNNLPEPTIGPNSATTSDENFNTVLYTGTGSARTVTGVGFQPDWLWIKKRSAAENHALYDVLRGPTKRLESNNTNVEDAETGGVSSFDSDGFSISGASDRSNTSGATYVAWNWKGNGSGVTNTDGSITSTVSANTDAGISIVTYTGTGSAATVGHGLGVAPKFIAVKARTSTVGNTNWRCYHESLGNTNGVFLNLTNASTAITDWNSTSPTSSVFSLLNGSETNTNTNTYVAYCFAEVEGFSSFGSYTGNGSTDGPFIYTGFRPAFVIIKRIETAGNGWAMFDDKRTADYNAVDTYFYANTSGAEDSPATDRLDFVSNGIKIRNNSSPWNTAGATYIYMAFAENPFKYANAR